MNQKIVSLDQILAEVTNIRSVLQADKDGSKAKEIEDYLRSLSGKYEEARLKLTDYEHQTHAALLRDAFLAGARTVSTASDQLR